MTEAPLTEDAAQVEGAGLGRGERRESGMGRGMEQRGWGRGWRGRGAERGGGGKREEAKRVDEAGGEGGCQDATVL